MGIAATIEEKMKSGMASQGRQMKEMNIEMAMKNRQVGMAMQMAVGKERFFYYSIFVFGAFSFLPIAAFKTKKP